MAAQSELANWIPSRLWWHEGQPAVTWTELGTERFDKPFFHQTLDAALARPDAPEAVHTGVNALIAEAKRAQESGESLAPPSGMIFHMSRCGSTLLSSGLAQEPSALILGEPNPLGDYFEVAQALPSAHRHVLLRALLVLLGRRRAGETQFAIKTMSQLAVFLPFLLQALPRVRFLFLYRDPLEVLVSLMEGENFVTGLHARPKRAELWSGIPAAEVAALPPAVFAARMLARICATAAEVGEQAPSRLRVLAYPWTPEALAERAAPFLGIEMSPAARRAAEALAGQDAKDPGRAFSADGEEKRARASAELRAAAERWLAPEIARLRTLRQL